MEALKRLRTKMQEQGIDYYLVPRTDEFQSEYLAPYAERLAYLTGFTGSYAFAIVGLCEAAVFTDGRYELQIAAEVDQSDFEIHLISNIMPKDWLSKKIEIGNVIGYEPDLFTPNHLKCFKLDGISFKPLAENLIDQIWKGKPAHPKGQKIAFDPASAGQTSESKIELLCEEMKERKVDYLIVTKPDSICWLLNIRGDDIPYNPLILSYLLLDQSGEYRFYSFHEQDPDHAILLKDICKIKEKSCFWIDPDATPLHIMGAIKAAGHDVFESRDPIMLKKACKNQVELDGMRTAHIDDGIAVSMFYMWLDVHYNPYVLTELDLVAHLLECRKLQPNFIQDSFRTISGSADHGAIIHYSVNHATNKMIEEDQLVLVDSGGQYHYGTTDITRVFIKGKPTDHMIKDYTNVLKGHIALSQIIFPEGTKGVQLDVLARQYLWHDKCNFAHGTGHGVGHFACVHEGPQRISPNLIDEALRPGMVISNEPGIYRKGEYGIRLENLVIVKEVAEGLDGEKYYGFENLTWVPFENRLIDKNMLTENELDWLNHYHQTVKEKLMNNIVNCLPEFEDWLDEKCAILNKK